MTQSDEREGDHGEVQGVYFVKDMILTCVRVALRFRTKAIRCHNVPEKITIDGSEAHAATIRTYNQEHGTTITMRQMKNLNHGSVTRVTRPMLGCKSFDAAQSTFIGIELMHMLRKGQLEDGVAQDLTPAEPFYALAA
jgi:putative transposase